MGLGLCSCRLREYLVATFSGDTCGPMVVKVKLGCDSSLWVHWVADRCAALLRYGNCTFLVVYPLSTAKNLCKWQ